MQNLDIYKKNKYDRYSVSCFFFSYRFHINFITNMKLLLQTTRVISFNFESKIINRISI